MIVFITAQTHHFAFLISTWNCPWRLGLPLHHLVEEDSARGHHLAAGLQGGAGGQPRHSPPLHYQIWGNVSVLAWTARDTRPVQSPSQLCPKFSWHITLDFLFHLKMPLKFKYLIQDWGKSKYGVFSQFSIANLRAFYEPRFYSRRSIMKDFLTFKIELLTKYKLNEHILIGHNMTSSLW